MHEPFHNFKILKSILGIKDCVFVVKKKPKKCIAIDWNTFTFSEK